MNDTLRDLDPSVLKAMEKWPDVPECFGWLELDRRGGWRLQGKTISHAGAVAFLGRNYFGDEYGRWAVQNGPQRVFVRLHYTPWIFRFDPVAGFTTHTGLESGQIDALYTDDEGNLLLACARGVGLIDDRDLATIAEFLTGDDTATSFTWQTPARSVGSVERAAVPQRFGFVADPQPR